MLLIMITDQENRRDSEFKQLAFETAIRNPERYKEILSFMKKYEGMVLNDENLLTIVSNMYIEGLVTSSDFNIDNCSNIKEIEQRVIEINSTRRSDGQFPAGYPSRFWTYMRTPSEFGLVYARYNEVFKIGEVANKLIKNEIDPQEAFSLQAVKYNRRSPYKNVSNDFNYFRFLINVLKKLNSQGKKLSYNQFIISLFSKDGNVDDFINQISNHSFPSREILYDYLKDTYPRVNSIKTVTQDYPDVVLRMLRITGFVNIKYNGILLIDFNKENEDYINKLLELDYTLSDEEKNNPAKYFNKIEKITDKELEIIYSNRTEKSSIIDYNATLNRIINEYELNDEAITENVLNICRNNRTDERFRYLSEPLKFEFFMSLFLYITYGNKYQIKPNYKVDANGLPISHAPANIGDIEVKGDNIYWLIEVTLITNRTQQGNNETLSLFKHLNADKTDKKYLSLVAPTIHDETQLLFKTSTLVLIMEGMSRFYAKPYEIAEFIDVCKKNKNFEDMEVFMNKIKQQARAAFN